MGEIDKTIEGSGGYLNAYTTFDHTVCHVNMSREDLNVGLECIGEMMGFPLFNPEEINKEREVVIEEIKRSSDSPLLLLAKCFFQRSFKSILMEYRSLVMTKILEKSAQRHWWIIITVATFRRI